MTNKNERGENGSQENGPVLVGGGLSKEELEKMRQRVNSLGKCCEGGSEGWTG